MCAFWRGRERMSSELGPLDCPPAPSFTPTPRRSMTTSVAPGHGASRAASDHDRGGFGARCYGAAFVPAGRSIGIGSWVGAWQLSCRSRWTDADAESVAEMTLVVGARARRSFGVW